MEILNGKTYNLQNEQECTQYWEDYAKSELLGKKVIGVRYMSKADAEKLGWNKRALVIQLEGGVLIYPSQDDEGNDGGALFGQKKSKKGKSEDLTFPVLR